MSQGIQKYEPVFLDAVARVLRDEGGYVNNPEDPGGETKFGISKRTHPNVDIRNLTPEQATEIYWNDFWLKPGFDKLKGDVASKVFDLSVVMGEAPAVDCLIRALRACGATLDHSKCGRLDIAIVTTANTFTNVPALLAAIRSEAAGHFRAIVAGNPRMSIFLKGWLNRAYE
jgi:lysozyme family protein